MAASVAAATAIVHSPAVYSAEASVLEEVVVTARFRTESLQETPIAITAITADAIEMKSLAQVADIGAVVPNSFIRPQGTQNGPAPAIGLRGVIQSDFSFSFEPGVAVYIDDVYHGTLLGSSFDLLDLERIEVLRGPQGTLFGKNALGGAIRTVSKKPQGDNTGYVEATYGSSNRLNFKAGADLALIEDRLFMRVTGLSKSIDGYQDRLDFTCEMIRRGTPQLAGIGDGIGADGSAGGGFDGRPDAVGVGSAADNAFFFPQSKPGLSPDKGCKIGSAGGESVIAGRAMFRLLASDALEFNLTGDYTRDTSEVGVDDLFQLNADPNPNTVNPGRFADLYNRSRPPFSPVATYTDLNYGIPYDARFLTGDPFKTYSTFNDPVNGTSFPADNLIEAWGLSGAMDYRFADALALKFIVGHRQYDAEFSDDRDHSPIGLQVVYTLAEHEQSTAELQLSGRMLDRLDWTLGAFYYEAETFWGGSPQLLDSPAGAFIHNDTAKTDNFSSFAHVVLDLSGSWSLTGGLRYTDESKDYHFDHSPNVGAADASTSSSRFDWKVGLDYNLTDSVLLYTQVATGFRSEAFNVRIFTAAQLANTPIDAEELTSYEIGMKGDWFDNRLRANLAAFYSDYETRVILQSATECPPSPTPLLGAFGLICPNGSPGIPWFFYLNTPAEIRGVEGELTIRPTDGLTVDATFGWLEFESPDYHPDNLIQPEWNGSLGVQYQFLLGGGGTLTPRLDWFYQGEMTYPRASSVAATDSDILDDHVWGNGRITYETADRDWSVALAVTNVTDKFFHHTWFGSGATFRTGNPVRPREWSLNFRRRFQ